MLLEKVTAIRVLQKSLFQTSFQQLVITQLVDIAQHIQLTGAHLAELPHEVLFQVFCDLGLRFHLLVMQVFIDATVRGFPESGQGVLQQVVPDLLHLVLVLAGVAICTVHSLYRGVVKISERFCKITINIGDESFPSSDERSLIIISPTQGNYIVWSPVLVGHVGVYKFEEVLVLLVYDLEPAVVPAALVPPQLIRNWLFL